ncbi:MAG: hypothetical protein Q8P50_05380, partial [Bacillota bacterium]|nr:hypothetical protein [Bacillota bacterium]
WSLAAACTFWYSWGKQHYMCEAALGLGFLSFAVMFGAATTPDGLGQFGVACWKLPSPRRAARSPLPWSHHKVGPLLEPEQESLGSPPRT